MRRQRAKNFKGPQNYHSFGKTLTLQFPVRLDILASRNPFSGVMILNTEISMAMKYQSLTDNRGNQSMRSCMYTDFYPLTLFSRTFLDLRPVVQGKRVRGHEKFGIHKSSARTNAKRRKVVFRPVSFQENQSDRAVYCS